METIYKKIATHFVIGPVRALNSKPTAAGLA